jgi:prophage tail gpP-like protein
MPGQDKPRLTLRIGGRSHDDWERFDVDSDLLTPAGAWQLSVGTSEPVLPADVVSGAQAELRYGDSVIMTGMIDEVSHDVSRGQHYLELTGRDAAAVLVDCSAPVFTAQEMTLQEVITQVVKPLGVTRIRMQAEKTGNVKKVSIEPGDSAWDALKRAAETSGLWPWMAPDGTLIIGGPDYSTAPVDTLVMNRDGQNNNLLRLGKRTDMSGRYSQTTVLAQSHGTGDEDGKASRKCTVKDITMTVYRPRIVVEGDAQSDEEVQYRARKLQADARLNGLALTATVRGFTTADGILWAPGQRVTVKSDVHGLDEVYFIMRRTFRGGRGQRQETSLLLREDGIWLPDAYPKSRRKKGHKRGKKDKGLWTTWEQVDNA